jgi:hypothetical protein
MNPPVDVSKLPLPAQKILDPAGPAPLKAMAAKGIVPGLKPGDIVTVVALLAESADPAVAQTAQATLRALPPPVLDGALGSALPPGVVDLLADAYLANDAVLAKLLGAPGILPATVAKIAEHGSEAACERVAVNEALLLEHPQIIERLYMNRATRMSTADRVLELAVRNALELEIPAFKEAAAAIKDELIAEPSEEPTPDDLLYAETEQLAANIALDLEGEDTHEMDDEGNEVVTDSCKPLWVQVQTMTVTQKIRRALLGSATERLLLVRDSNRLVSSAAIRSPLIREPEVVLISGSRAVDDEVLRIIANSREWTRSYQVKLNLVMNPRTPFMFASKLIPHLRDHELKAIMKSKNVTGAVATAARQHMQRRGQKG